MGAMNDPAAMEEQRRIMEEFERMKNQDLCHFCKMIIGKDENTVLLQSSDCFHSVHLECFKIAAKKALASNQDLACPQPDCGK